MVRSDPQRCHSSSEEHGQAQPAQLRQLRNIDQTSVTTFFVDLPAASFERQKTMREHHRPWGGPERLNKMKSTGGSVVC
jgi:hypothetical protein